MNQRMISTLQEMVSAPWWKRDDEWCELAWQWMQFARGDFDVSNDAAILVIAQFGWYDDGVARH